MKTLFEVTFLVVERAAICFEREDPQIDPEFWEHLYGPYGDGPDDVGMIEWLADEYDWNEVDPSAV